LLHSGELIRAIVLYHWSKARSLLASQNSSLEDEVLFPIFEPFLYFYVRFRLPIEREMEVSGAAQTPYYSLITEGKNPRGIPGAKFIDNIEDFLHSTNLEAALGALNELYSKVGNHFHHSLPHCLDVPCVYLILPGTRHLTPPSP